MSVPTEITLDAYTQYLNIVLATEPIAIENEIKFRDMHTYVSYWIYIGGIR